MFALKQAVALYDAYTQQIQDCDAAIEQQVRTMVSDNNDDLPPLGDTDKRKSHSKNGPSYEARDLLYRLMGVDLVAVTGLNALTVQTTISEVGLDMSRFPNEKHFCSFVGVTFGSFLCRRMPTLGLEVSQ
ncbi:MAG: hypothetical protein U0768_09340 [Anaerolineae bacterium]